MALSRLTPAKEAFARDVARRTGLSLATVHAWVVSEGNKWDDNPLNIRRADGGFGGFGSWQAAADATVRLLNSNPSYEPILRVARAPQATSQHELWAIIESPWAAGHYTTRGSRTTGNILIGAYASLYPKSPSASTPAGPTASPTSGTPIGWGFLMPPFISPIPPIEEGIVPDIVPDVGEPLGDLARWIGERAARAFLYVVLSVAGAALILLGLMRATGTTRPQIASAIAARRAPDDIPF